MKEEELKEIISAMLHYLKKQIDPNAPVTIDEALEHLEKDRALLYGLNYRNHTLDETLESLKEKYKELARESIDSYENSTKNMQEIARKQSDELQKIASEKTKGIIDLDEIKEKFNSIQEHMVHEVERANQEITQLREKVKLLEEKNNLDALTKVFNRRALQSYLSTLTQMHSIQKELHLLMIDIDNFKQINDRYGHVAGDKILVFIAQTLKKTLREGDKVFRYGGEEFVVILNRIDTQKCILIANRILQLISNNKLVYKNFTIEVTVSIGGTRLIPGEDTPESILERSDKALYSAKRNGKNQFQQYREDMDI